MAGKPGEPTPELKTQRIYIPLVDNLTTKTGVEAQITTALRETLSGVKGARVVASESEADYLLLGVLTRYSRSAGSNPITGSETSEKRGGLLENESMAQELRVTLSLEARLLERSPSATGMRRVVWTRNFTESASYTASSRFTERAGSSSAVHLNNSREMIRVKSISEAIAQKILDQVAQDF